jgi:predicted metal-dependent phosphoesterase TrpH
MYKYELHAHTSQCDKVARLGGAELVRAYADKGYDGIVITDHYFSIFFDWFKDEINEKNHKETVERWLRGYYDAKNEGDRIGFTVLSGAEVRIDGTINDYLIYGLEAKDFFNLPFLNRMKSIDCVLDVLPPHALAVQAHPFRDKMTVCDPSKLFGIEVYNAGTSDFRNSMAQLWAEHYQKAMTSGSDCHKESAVGLGGILTNERIRSSKDLIRVLTSQNYQLIKP